VVPITGQDMMAVMCDVDGIVKVVDEYRRSLEQIEGKDSKAIEGRDGKAIEGKEIR
jgi:hypothetical protein